MTQKKCSIFSKAKDKITSMTILMHGHVAILIDSDQPWQRIQIEQVLKFSEYYGTPIICRAYGDWEKPNLSSRRNEILTLNIELIQVNRVGKNATDHRLLIDAGEILGNMENNVSVFVIVSGDGGFASACNRIRERGLQVVGIGARENTSMDLKEICDEFHYLEDLGNKLSELENLHPIPPSEVRAFYKHLMFAYGLLTKNEDWVSYAQLGEKLRELVPDYESKFGQYKLSDWLRNFDKYFESHDQMVRRIDLYPEITRRDMLIDAYLKTKGSDGLASLAKMGKVLREDPNYERRFGGKKLSEWLANYPDIFEIRENSVCHPSWYG